jgi:hypothetical protein
VSAASGRSDYSTTVGQANAEMIENGLPRGYILFPYNKYERGGRQAALI